MAFNRLLRNMLRPPVDSYAWRRLYSSLNSKILGIETSCDDTGCAIVDEKGQIISEFLFSQQDIHTKLGGIIPPIARDYHRQNIDKVVCETLKLANMNPSELDAVAVTVKPGLPLSLEVGVSYAKALCKSARKPLIQIHHMEAHALTIRMLEKVPFPFLVLLVSGGHCLLAVAESINSFLLLGKTMDDAPGEAFDKIARRLKVWNLEGLDGMSGGKAIETLAKAGDAKAFPIAEPLLNSMDCNFSFAGIKNSARQFILDQEQKHGVEGGEVLPNISDLSASIQFAIAKHLCRRLQRAMAYVEQKQLIPKDRCALVVSGGVASNLGIREALFKLCDELGYSLHVPPPRLCTDNGVMIAWNGVEKWNAGIDITPYEEVDTVDFQSKVPFGEDISEEVGNSGIKCRWDLQEGISCNLCDHIVVATLPKHKKPLPYCFTTFTVHHSCWRCIKQIARRLKVWNLEGLDGMSGGKAIETLAKAGDAKAFPIAEPLLNSMDCNFSFAGIKNSARQFILDQEQKHGVEGGEVLPNISDLSASIQFAIAKHLCRRLQRAMAYVEQKQLIPKDRCALVVSGGVASNLGIREALLKLCDELGYSLHVPPPRLCTDNGVMIAWNGVEKWNAGIDITPYEEVDTVDFQSKVPFGEDISEEVGNSGIKCRWDLQEGISCNLCDHIVVATLPKHKKPLPYCFTTFTVHHSCWRCIKQVHGEDN